MKQVDKPTIPEGPTWKIVSPKKCYKCEASAAIGTVMHWVEVPYGLKKANVLCCEVCARAHAEGTAEVKVR